MARPKAGNGAPWQTALNRAALSLLFIILTGGCAVTLDASIPLMPEDMQEEIVPDACSGVYNRDGFNVAVVEFQNNTAYQRGQVDTVSSRSNTGVMLSPGFIGALGYSSYESASRFLEPQLGEFAQSATESVLIQLGGINVIARSELEQILKEQQFQMTIADPNTAVNFGHLAGARYIVTGSVDNIKVSYLPQVQPVIAGGSRDSLIASLIFSIGVLTYDVLAAGWNVETELSVSVVDVETAQVIANTRVKGAKNIGTSPTFSLEQLIEGAKSAMSDSLSKVIPMLAEQFKVKGYINELRGGKKIALVSVGSSMGLKEGDKLIPQMINVQTDFATKVQRCTITPLNFTLTVSSSLGSDHAWARVDTSDRSKLTLLKVGTLIYKSVK
ncbi:MAG: CsgG/HfaB family protein [Deferribacteraceae bacterium]|jgi:curli biogenesis system outer membrane secretion channel CsgG|nr:CsgG/HfaB family protein [Deferribacteraceae bacterium]